MINSNRFKFEDRSNCCTMIFALYFLTTKTNVIFSSFRSLQLATNLRDAINNWNLGTNQWLRVIVYERVPKKYATILTFSLSALWHGFYFGYYMTFATGALFVTAARSVCFVLNFHNFPSLNESYPNVSFKFFRTGTKNVPPSIPAQRVFACIL